MLQVRTFPPIFDAAESHSPYVKHNLRDTFTTQTSNRVRPSVKTFPEPIPHTLENVALSVLNSPPKKDRERDYLKDGQ